MPISLDSFDIPALGRNGQHGLMLSPYSKRGMMSPSSTINDIQTEGGKQPSAFERMSIQKLTLTGQHSSNL